METHIIITDLTMLQADTMATEDIGEMTDITTETTIRITMTTECHIIITIIIIPEEKYM